jgi:hypothetical protein
VPIKNDCHPVQLKGILRTKQLFYSNPLFLLIKKSSLKKSYPINAHEQKPFFLLKQMSGQSSGI